MIGWIDDIWYVYVDVNDKLCKLKLDCFRRYLFGYKGNKLK